MTGKFAKGRMKNMERINRDVGDIDDVRVGWLVFLEAWEEVATLEYYCETHIVSKYFC